MQCELHFELEVHQYQTPHSKITYIISHLLGRAEAGATSEWSRRSVICDSLQTLTKSFTCIFQYASSGREAARALMKLRQGRKRVADYAIEFRTLSADSGWNASALADAFIRGLSSSVKDS